MPRSSGTYTAPSSSVNPAVEGTVIDETDFNALVDDIESALTESVYTSGVGSTDNRLVRVDGTDTKKVQGSAATLDDSGNLSGIVNLSATGYIDITEMVAPSSPSANVGRLYVADDSGTTKIYFVDSVGTTTNLLAPAATISDGDKGDITTSSSGATWTIDNGAVTYAKLQDVSATSRVIGRKTSGAGDAEELTASEVLDFISSTQGEILYRGASAWSGLGVGTSGQVLQSQGAGAAPQWATVAGTGDVTAAASITDNRIVRGDGGAKGVQESLVAIDDSGNVTGVASLDVGNADTTLTRSGAGDIAVEGNVVYRAGGTDVALADGGTGASLTDPNADRILFWDDSAGAVTWLEAGSGLTISGTTISASGSGGAPSIPQGRLTLSTATPVMTSTVSAATTVYYTPHVGQYVPLYDGSAWSMVDIGGELSQATTDTTKSPAAVTTNSLYDVFVWNDSGTYRATRGPAWSSATARGTGAATTELELLNGIWVNKVDITNGPAARRGTFVGTIASNGSSQIDFILPQTASSGATAGYIGVCNAYNLAGWSAVNASSTDSWTYGTFAWRQTENSTGWQTTMVSALPGLYVAQALYVQWSASSGGTSGNGRVSIGYDSTSTPASVSASAYGAVTGVAIVGTCFHSQIVGLGRHYVAALEYGSNSGGTNLSFLGDNGTTSVIQSGMIVRGFY